MGLSRLLPRNRPKLGRLVSLAGLRFIESFEGFVDHLYNDGTGTMTIGFGTTAADVPMLPTHISRAAAQHLLHHKLNVKYAPAIHALNVPLTQDQFNAVISFIYNLGPGVIGPGTHLRRLLVGRQWREFADAILAYDHAGGQVMAGLARRRRAEAKLFLRHT